MVQTRLFTPGAGDIPAVIAEINNLTATTDPTVSNDGTQGYSIGSIWYNGTAGQLRWWECYSASTGAAVWVFSGAAYAAGGTAPSSEVVQFGSGLALCAAEGNISRQVFGTAVNPGGTGGDYVLGVYSLPASSFDVAGRGLNVLAQGSFATNTNNKRVKLMYGCTTATVGSAVSGGTAIADTGTVTTSNAGWILEANVFKYGAAGSNTQLGLHTSAQAGSTIGPLLNPTLLTSPENAAILIAVTGNATTTATDIGLSFFEQNAMN